MTSFLLTPADRLGRPCSMVLLSTSADGLHNTNSVFKMLFDEFAGSHLDGKVLWLLELSDVLDRDYQGFPSTIVDMMKCKGSVVDIDGCLDIQLIQGFRGTIESKWKLIQIHERAQIIGFYLWIIYGRESTQPVTLYHFRSLNDICRLKTSFSD